MASVGPAEDLADVMAANGIGSVTGTAATIFSGRLPASPDDVIAVRDMSGRRATRAMGPNGTPPLVRHPDVHVTVRNSTYEGVYNKVAEITALFGWWTGTVNGRTYSLVEVAYEPVYVGEDENERHQVSLVLSCQLKGA